MRKFAVTSFALLYGILIVSASAERSNEWAARLAPLLHHSVFGRHLPCFGKMEKSETHQWQTKIVEPGFVVESPREAVAVPTCSGRHPVPSYCDYDATWTGQPFSPRGPPRQI